MHSDENTPSEAMGIDSEQRITFFIADIASFYYLLLSTQTAISTLWQPGPLYRQGESLDISNEKIYLNI